MMLKSSALAEVLPLLSGELRDSTGKVLTPTAKPIVAVQHHSDARTALASGTRVALVIPLGSFDAPSRLMNLCLARVRLALAHRRLRSSGAELVRAFAIVTANDALYLAYELGETIQPYIEGYIVLAPPASWPARAAKRVMGAMSGLPTSVDFVVVVGVPA